MQVKICGLCRSLDAEAAVQAGADYVGVILAPDTRRSQSLDSAAAILSASGNVRRVGVFVNPRLDDVSAAVDALALQVVQLHGQETPELLDAISGTVQVWKAVRVRTPDDVMAAAADWSGATALLLDAFHPTLAGGTGAALAWDALTSVRRDIPSHLRIGVAGGLTPENVAVAITALAPDFVDVSSGVETEIGEKSAALMQSFVSAAHQTMHRRSRQ